MKNRKVPTTQADENRAESFAKAFHALKQTFARYERDLHVTANTREKYYLQTKSVSLNNRPLFFGAVLRGKDYVSLHLMPLYWDPLLAKGLSAGLKKHMQGTTTFQFTEIPATAQFREMGRLVSRGFNLYRRKNLL